MKKKKKWIKWVVILVIVAAVIGWFMMVSRKTQDVAYTDVQATLGSIETYYNFDGLVKAKRVQTITAAVSTPYSWRESTTRRAARQASRSKKASACIGWRAAKPLRPISRAR